MRLNHQQILRTALIVLPALVFMAGFAGADETEDSDQWKSALPLAEEGNALAQCELGQLIMRGRDAHHSKKEAAGWFFKASEKDALCGLLAMGDMTRQGIGTRRDEKVTFDYYRRALPQVEALARGGDVQMMIQAGKMYQRGWGTDANLESAGRWNILAARYLEPLVVAGNVDAHKKLGNILIVGIGVPRDVIRAGQLYEAAAQTGDRTGQFLAGLMWFKGRAGHPVDHARGFRWLFHAAEQDHPRSQFLVGTGFAEGLGTDVDVAEAAMWLKLALDRGYSNAKAALEELGDGQKVKDGIAAADLWLPIFERPDANS